ncbi:MAG: FAD-dependent oxidoreductase [Acidimicrobiales bacterium]
MTTITAADGVSFWAAAPTTEACPPLMGHQTADVAVLGGGFAGLSAAYHLVCERPDLDVAVVESQQVGAGASGRNTGILRPGVGGTMTDLCRRFGDQEAARLYRASVDASVRSEPSSGGKASGASSRTCPTSRWP